MTKPSSSSTSRNNSASGRSQSFDEPSTLEEWQVHARTLQEVLRVEKLGYWKKTLSTGEVFWSDVVYELFGVDPLTFSPDNGAFLTMVHPHDRERVEKSLYPMRLTGFHDITYRIIPPDGSVRWLREVSDNTPPDDLGILVGVVRDITEHKELEEKLRTQAITDDMTGIYNRRYFMKRLKQAFAHYQRSDQNAVVLLLDIDHFKMVNDTYGHAMGDRVLKELSALFKARFRQTDVVGRLGGEEFSVLLFDISVDDAAGVAEEIREALAEMAFSTDAGEVFYVSVTCGIADFAEDDDTEGGILQRADDSLYLGKRRGRNQVVVEHLT
ncbi:diguanylate cyclase [Halomonas sp. LR5S13]|uniref:GGDEF domain-containing protein n=1 Tax=Halomonas rhizosphaerae TaxID=3043296 RepID=UPI0024A8586A|nr:diguanylate cyclase [Halomonas rhizosphaerae]MDI5920433.1 diguanylate cyclase [Halomonas rhizosphaerae]